MAVIYAGPKLKQIQQFVRTELTEIAWDYQAAGEAVSQYDVIFRDGSFWKKADARSPSLVPSVGVGMAQDTVLSGGANLDVWIRAIVSNGGWALTSGARVYLASGGGITMSGLGLSGDTSLTLGRALTTTAMEFNPGNPVLIGQ